MRIFTLYIVVIFGVLFFSFLGLLSSKLNSNLSWKQLLLIKYKVMIVIPLVNVISNCITKKKTSLGMLYKIRNKLMDKLTKY